jgi:hypothetical protein
MKAIAGSVRWSALFLPSFGVGFKSARAATEI